MRGLDRLCWGRGILQGRAGHGDPLKAGVLQEGPGMPQGTGAAEVPMGPAMAPSASPLLLLGWTGVMARRDVASQHESAQEQP